MHESIAKSIRDGRTVTLVGVLVNTILIILKLMTGIFGNSQALIADAVHSISDLFTDIAVLIGLQIRYKPPDEKHHFGHARVETLATSFVGIILIGTALYLGIDAAFNIYSHTESHPTVLALMGAGASVVLKEILYQYTIRTGRRIKSQLIVANAWHHRSDALSSVAVLVGVAGTQIRPSWYFLDAFAALLVSFFIVKVGLEILKEALHEFTDTAPGGEVIDRIMNCALTVNGVNAAHDLKVRTSGGRYQMEIHIVVDGRLTVIEGHKVAKAVEHCLAEDVGNFDHITVHVDPDISLANKNKE
ncbi:MAG: cation diffusion facilitator family transporter [Desulfobacterales bacterium]|nr:cation diffusion facilitator family transporter [Desulfobacterales bacterium]